MFLTILLVVTLYVCLLHVVGPIALRREFRFSAHCNPKLIPPQELAMEAAECILALVPRLESLGFEFLGSYDLGELSPHTKKIVAYFCHRGANDFANITVFISPGVVDSYLEFSTGFSTGLTLETNNNGVLPLTPDSRQSRVFRFSAIQEPRELYRLHRQLIEKYAAGAWAVPEAKGEEILRMVRTFENYGPRHAELVYMKLLPDGEGYGLTWKGAALMSWRRLWPASTVRYMLHHQRMRAELRSLEIRGVTALQKA